MLKFIMDEIVELDIGCNQCNLEFQPTQSVNFLYDIEKHLQVFLSNWKKLKLKYILNKFCNPADTKDMLKKFQSKQCSYSNNFMLQALQYNDSSEAKLTLIKSELELEQDNSKSILKSHALDWRQVYCFLLWILNHTVPMEVFGSKTNFNLFTKSIKDLLLIGRHDKMFLNQLMFETKVLDCE